MSEPRFSPVRTGRLLMFLTGTAFHEFDNEYNGLEYPLIRQGHDRAVKDYHRQARLLISCHDSLMARARRCDRCDSLVSRPQWEVRSRHITQLQLIGLNRLSCYRRDMRNHIVNMTSARPGHHNRILLSM